MRSHHRRFARTWRSRSRPPRKRLFASTHTERQGRSCLSLSTGMLDVLMARRCAGSPPTVKISARSPSCSSGPSQQSGQLAPKWVWPMQSANRRLPRASDPDIPAFAAIAGRADTPERLVDHCSAATDAEYAAHQGRNTQRRCVAHEPQTLALTGRLTRINVSAHTPLHAIG